MIYISRTSKLLAARKDITTPHLLIATIIASLLLLEARHVWLHVIHSAIQ